MQFRAPFPLFTLATAVSLSVAPPAFSGPAVCVETNDVIRITLRGKPVLTYQKAIVAPPGDMEDLYSRSGYIHPVYSPSGKEVTGDFPVDHPHQHALFFAWTSTTFEGRKVDFWNRSPSDRLLVDPVFATPSAGTSTTGTQMNPKSSATDSTHNKSKPVIDSPPLNFRN